MTVSDVLPWEGYPGAQHDALYRRADLWPRHRSRDRKRRRRRTSINRRTREDQK